MIRRSSLWSLQFGIWLAFGGAMSIGRAGEWPLAWIVTLEWPYAALGFLTTLLLVPLYARLDAGRAPLVRIAGLSLLGSWTGALLWTAAVHVYWDRLAPSIIAAWPGDVPVHPGYSGPLLDNTVFNTFPILAWSAFYFGIAYYGALQLARERAILADARAHEAQLRALRYQLNPHFLFNTLNAISTLVGEQKVREARAMIARLSEFLRMTLEGGPTQVPLSAEVEFALRYLDIEQIRFGDRLQVRTDIGSDVLQAAVPSLILQPLIENAIKYAVAMREEGGSVSISARRIDGQLEVSVQDDGPGLAAARSSAGLGVGIANTRDRLEQLFGDAGRLDVGGTETGGVRATIRLPLRPCTPVPAVRQ